MSFAWTPLVAGVTEIKAAPLNELAAKVGDDGSAVVTSLDYLLKNPLSINPGHLHTPLCFSAGADGNLIFRDPADHVWKYATPDAAGLVAKAGDQTIAGVKTFASIPVGPAADPTTDHQFTRKAYVDLRLLTATYASAASIDPGHKHSGLWASDGFPQAIYVDAAGNVGICEINPNFMSFGVGATVLTIRGRETQQGGHLGIATFDSRLTDDSNLGSIRFYNNAALVCRIQAISSGTGGIYGNLNFYTTGPDGINVNRLCLTSGGRVGIGTAGPNDAALLHMVSTTKGFLPPVMTTTQRDAISSPPEALIVGDLTLHAPAFYNGSIWKTIAALESPIFTTPNIGVGSGISLALSGGFGCNGATIQSAYASGGVLAAYVTGAFGLDSDAHMQAMFNLVAAMRAALVANGIMS